MIFLLILELIIIFTALYVILKLQSDLRYLKSKLERAEKNINIYTRIINKEIL